MAKDAKVGNSPALNDLLNVATTHEPDDNPDKPVNRKSMLSDDYGLVISDDFYKSKENPTFITNLYSEDSDKFNGYNEDKFLRTDTDRNLTSKINVKADGGSLVLDKTSNLELGDFKVELSEGSIAFKLKE